MIDKLNPLIKKLIWYFMIFIGTEMFDQLIRSIGKCMILESYGIQKKNTKKKMEVLGTL